ncbi:hypothetical protein [Rhodococcus sp. SGAir0479]|uniref:hypothetical protein n=1 Tax=Rhodococcus sp. SGAir0479 TaxID=2567884 RepID=UPI0010CCF3ED|nr:hypothetical protein [Rhodococcus sp. SGAir0479]QCQ93033.1 hypothetical protein E7742_18615 [Rhodococcus sp. SGAir0479]
MSTNLSLSPAVEAFMTQVTRAGRVHGPELLYDAWVDNELDHETLSVIVPKVWTSAEYPQGALDEETWRAILEDTVFTIDGRQAERPEVVRLYRGAPREFRDGWAWTADQDVARKFASGGLRGRAVGSVYVADVPGWRLWFVTNERSEAEYVIETDGLDIRVCDEGAVSA